MSVSNENAGIGTLIYETETGEREPRRIPIVLFMANDLWTMDLRGVLVNRDHLTAGQILATLETLATLEILGNRETREIPAT